MKLNQRVQKYMAWGTRSGRESASTNELPGMAPFSFLPISFAEDRLGRACQLAFEDAFFDAYLTKATGKTTGQVWEERGVQA